MPIALNREIRKTLNDVVRKARVAAEDGAQSALRQLGVADAKRPTWLSDADAALRVRLRAHAKTLGDALDTGDPARMPRLVREIAYAHWHRALFARFLLENGLLVDVEAGNAPVRPDELREIADAEGRDVAEVAAEFAEPMLPEIFPKDDPVLALALPPETRQRLSELVDGMPAQTFKADDALGWTYQFWQEDRKKKVNESVAKIGAEELPAVTQLFTEDYMVLFLLENTLGAWWAGKKLAETPDLVHDTADEDELRRKLSLPGYTWTYLRFVQEDGAWRPAAGTFPDWPERASELTVLDPCMGSGHFLVFALDILVALRKAEEGLNDEAAVVSVLRDNLHGLEIDPRCTQIAAFALALAAWKRLGGVRPLPKLHLACSGLSIGMGKADFVALAEKIAEAEEISGDPSHRVVRDRNPMENTAVRERRHALESMYDLFKEAPSLGSLIDPRYASDDVFGPLFARNMDDMPDILQKVLAGSRNDPDMCEAAVTAQGLAKSAELLSQTFTLIVTNVPYLGNRKQSQTLREYASRRFPVSKTCLSTMMIERFLGSGSCKTFSVVSPQAWFQQPSYSKFLRQVVFPREVVYVVRYGVGAFETISGEVVSVAGSIIHADFDLANYVNTLDLSDVAGAANKALASQTLPTQTLGLQPMRDKGYFMFEAPTVAPELGNCAFGSQGVKTGDDEKFVCKFWEFDQVQPTWRPYLGTSQSGTHYSGRSSLLRWGSNGDGLIRSRRNSVALNQEGVALNQMGEVTSFIYTGELFDSNVATVIPSDPENLLAVYAYLKSEEFLVDLSRIESGMKVNNGTIFRVPFDRKRWSDLAKNLYPAGLPRPYSNDPTQWLFDGHPRGSAEIDQCDCNQEPVRPGMAEHPLQVAVARLLGYRWPRQTGLSLMGCSVIEGPDEIERAGVVDADGIVCLPAIHGEAAAHERVRSVLKAAWGKNWADGVERSCLDAEDWNKDLESWLADGFFEGHCKLFHKKPFIWHIWDGIGGGFSALVNYHKLCAANGSGRRMLEKIRDTYLGEWIGTQRRLVTSGDATAEDRLSAAEHLRDELTAIIEGEPPYDIFVRWKPLSLQPIGWEPDLCDGVRINIRPFLTTTTWRNKAKKACILRSVPGVKEHASADGGREAFCMKEDFPWFWAEDHDVATLDFAGGPEFKGRRYNDFHFTRSFKQATRDRKESSRSPRSEVAE